MKAAAYINPDEHDYSIYQNVQQSMLLRFAVAAVWFFILGLAQVGGCPQQVGDWLELKTQHSSVTGGWTAGH